MTPSKEPETEDEIIERVEKALLEPSFTTFDDGRKAILEASGPLLTIGDAVSINEKGYVVKARSGDRIIGTVLVATTRITGVEGLISQTAEVFLQPKVVK